MENVAKCGGEADRLKVLEKYQLLKIGVEQDFQNIVDLASQICETPSSLVSIVGADKQWFKGKKGDYEDFTSKEVSFCAHAIQQEDYFSVPDAREDDRFKNNPLVTKSPFIVFYAGFPVKIEGYNVGTICVQDIKPRTLSDDQISALKILSLQTAKLIELRRTEEELTKQNDFIKKRNEELNNSNKVNHQLMNMISHDIRGPIGSILSFFKSREEILKDDTILERFLPLVETSLQGIYKMVDNMLGWSKHVHNPKFKNVKIHEIVIDVERLYASQLLQKQNELQINVPEALEAFADQDALQFVIRNLVGNAIKYTENGCIVVEAEEREAAVIISVIDNGIGIPELMLEDIRNSEKKISTTGTKNEKGSGLGLNFTQELLRNMDSKLEITSVEKEGSTFSFSLPKAK